ncbi:alpha/beta-hydrolase [Ramicandelaber brevisporus]|nr:alpha/beta-hydrolase [Ramicandelaber brevisporus]
MTTTTTTTTTANDYAVLNKLTPREYVERFENDSFLHQFPWSTRPVVVDAYDHPYKLAALICEPKYGVDLRQPSSRAKPISILMCHANGMMKESWFPMIRQMLTLWNSASDRAWYIGEFILYDIRIQGDSAALNAGIDNWSSFGWFPNSRDMLALIDQIKPKYPLVGVGNSMGASGLVNAEAMRPSMLRAICMLDPTMLPYTEPEMPGMNDTIIQMALRRKAKWATVEDAIAYFNTKDFFMKWTKESLDLFVRYGLRNVINADGSKAVELKSSGEAEAICFKGGNIGGRVTIDKIAEVTLPLMAITEDSLDLLPFEIAEYAMESSQDGRTVRLSNSGHLMPLISPDPVAELAVDFIEQRQRTIFGTLHSFDTTTTAHLKAHL